MVVYDCVIVVGCLCGNDLVEVLCCCVEVCVEMDELVKGMVDVEEVVC